MVAHPSWWLGAVSGWHTHVGSRAPWGASRRLPKEMSHCSFLQGHLRNKRLPAALPVLEEEKGHCSSTAPFPLSPFCPPSHIFYVLASCDEAHMFGGKHCAFTQKSSRNHLKAKVNFCQVCQPGKGKCLSESWSFRLSRSDDTRYLSCVAYAEPPSASLQY